MKRLILVIAITLIVISGQGAKAQYPFSSKSTSFQASVDAWFTLSDVVQSEFSPDGRYLAVRTSTHFRVYDMQQDTPTIFIETEADSPHYFESPIAFSPDSQYVTINVPQQNPVQTVRVWDLTTGDVFAEITQEFFTVDDLAFSPAEPLLVIRHRDEREYWNGVLTIWQFETNIIRDIVHPGGGATLVSISPDGEWLLSNVINGTYSWSIIYNLQSGSIPYDSQLDCTCDISPTWEYAIMRSFQSNDTPYLVRLPTLEQLDLSYEFADTTTNFAWSFDGLYLAATEASGSTRIFFAQNGGWSQIDIGIDDGRIPTFTFHPSQNTVALQYEASSVEVWDIANRSLIKILTFSALTEGRGFLSHDWQKIAVRDGDNTWYIYDTESGILQYEIEATNEWPLRGGFSPDSRVFMVSNPYGSMEIWLWRLTPNSSENSE